MKNKLWKQWMLSGVLVSAMVVSCGVSVSVQAEETTETEEAAETDSSAESEDDLQILFDQAVEDAMIAEDGEILPVVSLDEGEPYAVYNEEGRVLLYTFHKYPDSYPDGTDVKLEWGNVWTFTGGELEDCFCIVSCLGAGEIIQSEYSLSAAHFCKLNLFFFTRLKSYRCS